MNTRALSGQIPYQSWKKHSQMFDYGNQAIISRETFTVGSSYWALASADCIAYADMHA